MTDRDEQRAKALRHNTGMSRIVVVDEQDLRSIIREEVAGALKAAPARDGDDLVDARTSGLGPTTFRRLAKTEQLPVMRVGRRLVARRSDVEAYLARQRVQKRVSEAASAQQDPITKALATGRLRVLGK
jgi:Helix-turn-helix domain